MCAVNSGNARVSGAGFGVSPKPSVIPSETRDPTFDPGLSERLRDSSPSMRVGMTIERSAFDVESGGVAAFVRFGIARGAADPPFKSRSSGTTAPVFQRRGRQATAPTPHH